MNRLKAKRYKLYYVGYHKRYSMQNDREWEDLIVETDDIDKVKKECKLFEIGDCDCDYCTKKKRG